MFFSPFQPPLIVLQLVGLLERGLACRFYRMMTEAVFDKRIPDKWRDYKACGVPIKGERIIAFKTPLSNKFDNESHLDNGIKPFERFTPMDLQIHLKQKKWKLGLVVDLTNTFRYYNHKEFSDHGVNYKKIKCIGREIPSEDVVKRFKTEVTHFLAASKDSLIGVHCTHGLNRTGYIVCRYLIECRGYTPEKAIDAFNEARGYPIERENYLQDLKTRTPKFEDSSSTQKEKRQKNVASHSRSRFIHTKAQSRQASCNEDFEAVDHGRFRYNRHQMEFSYFSPHHTPRRHRERHDFNGGRDSYLKMERNYNNNVLHKNNVDWHHRDDWRYRDNDSNNNNYYVHDRSNFSNNTRYYRQDYRQPQRKNRQDRVVRNKFSRNRHAPYS